MLVWVFGSLEANDERTDLSHVIALVFYTYIVQKPCA
jgi:hypothetical protein